MFPCVPVFPVSAYDHIEKRIYFGNRCHDTTHATHAQTERLDSMLHRTTSASSVGAISRTSCQLRSLAVAPMLTVNPKATLSSLSTRCTPPAFASESLAIRKMRRNKKRAFFNRHNTASRILNSPERTPDQAGCVSAAALHLRVRQRCGGGSGGGSSSF